MTISEEIRAIFDRNIEFCRFAKNLEGSDALKQKASEVLAAIAEHEKPNHLELALETIAALKGDVSELNSQLHMVCCERNALRSQLAEEARKS